MAVQPAHALEHEVHWAQVRDQEVEVDVEGLLGHLTGDHDVRPARPVPGGAEPVQQVAVLPGPVEVDEACVGDGDRLVPEALPQPVGGLQDPVDGVADDQRAAAVGEFGGEAVDKCVEFVVERLQVNGAPPGGVRGGPSDQGRMPRRDGGEQRITGFLRGHFGLGRRSAVGLHQGPPGRGRQRRRQHDHRHPVRTQPGEHPLQVGVHVGVVGVHFVDHDDLAGEREVAQCEMPVLETGEQHLVDGADREGGEQALLASAQPLVGDQPGVLPPRPVPGPLRPVRVHGRDPAPVGGHHARVLVVERGLRVGEEDRSIPVRGQVVQPRGETGEHRVGGRAGRQRDVASAGAGPGGEDLGDGERGLRLALAHRRLDHQQPRRGQFTRQPDGLLLDRPRRPPGGQLEAGFEQFLRPLRRVRRIPGGREVQPLPGGLDALRLRTGALLREVGEEIGIAGDPVGHDDDAGQEHLDGLRQLGALDRPQYVDCSEYCRARVEQLELHIAPQLFARPGCTDQVLAQFEVVQLPVSRRHPVVPTDDHRQLPGGPVLPLVPLHQPFLEDQLTGEPVRGGAPVVPVLLRITHRQPGRPHVLGEPVDLTRERGRGLPDVVHGRQPHGELPRQYLAASERVGDQLPYVPGKPPVPQQPGDGPAVRHVPPQRHPPGGVPVGLGPDGASGTGEARGQFRTGRRSSHAAIQQGLWLCPDRTTVSDRI